MVLLTISELILALTWWVCKKTVNSVFYMIWPVAPTTAEEISEIKKTLRELKELEMQRLKKEKSDEQIAEEAHSLMESSCPDLYNELRFGSSQKNKK